MDKELLLISTNNDLMILLKISQFNGGRLTKRHFLDNVLEFSKCSSRVCSRYLHAKNDSYSFAMQLIFIFLAYIVLIIFQSTCVGLIWTTDSAIVEEML